MLPELLVASCLLFVTVVIHASGMTLLVRRIAGSSILLDVGSWRVTWLLVGVAWVLLVLHLLDIGLWAVLFWWRGCFPDLESSLYFSGVTYATLGYGDVLLSKEWRLLAPLEALTGILMCGLSVSFFFVFLSNVVTARSKAGRERSTVRSSTS